MAGRKPRPAYVTVTDELLHHVLDELEGIRGALDRAFPAPPVKPEQEPERQTATPAKNTTPIREPAVSTTHPAEPAGPPAVEKPATPAKKAAPAKRTAATGVTKPPAKSTTRGAK